MVSCKKSGGNQKIYKERYISKYVQSQGYANVICLKEDDFPIGYINVDMKEAHDLGYGLRKEFWLKNSILNEKISKLDSEDRNRIYEVIDTLLKHTK